MDIALLEILDGLDFCVPQPTTHLEETDLLNRPSNKTVPILRKDSRGYGVSLAALRSLRVRKMDRGPPPPDPDEEFQSDDSAVLDASKLRPRSSSGGRGVLKPGCGGAGLPPGLRGEGVGGDAEKREEAVGLGEGVGGPNQVSFKFCAETSGDEVSRDSGPGLEDEGEDEESDFYVGEGTVNNRVLVVAHRVGSVEVPPAHDHGLAWSQEEERTGTGVESAERPLKVKRVVQFLGVDHDHRPSSVNQAPPHVVRYSVPGGRRNLNLSRSKSA